MKMAASPVGQDSVEINTLPLVSCTTARAELHQTSATTPQPRHIITASTPS